MKCMKPNPLMKSSKKIGDGARIRFSIQRLFFQRVWKLFLQFNNLFVGVSSSVLWSWPKTSSRLFKCGLWVIVALSNTKSATTLDFDKKSLNERCVLNGTSRPLDANEEDDDDPDLKTQELLRNCCHTPCDLHRHPSPSKAWGEDD